MYGGRTSKQVEVVLGVDGGGTKTEAVVADATGWVLGIGISGPSNYHAVGKENAISALHDAISRALDQARLDISAIKIAWMGLAAIDSERDYEVMREGLGGLLPHSTIKLDNDSVTALAAGTMAGPGIVVISGTGSVAFGANGYGCRRRVGGWGYLIGDEGSGYYIGLSGLRAAARAYDGRGQATRLVDDFVRILGIESFEFISYRIYVQKLERHEISKLAEVVIKAAQEGDAVAADIVSHAVEELALAVYTVARDLFRDAGKFQVVCSGGVFRNKLVFQRFCDAVRPKLPHAEIVLPKFKPVVGAVFLALRELGLDPRSLSGRALERLKMI